MKRNLMPGAWLFLLSYFLLTSFSIKAQQLTGSYTTSSYNGYQISCNGANNGTLTVTITDGTAPYIYKMADQSTAPINDMSYTFTNLSAAEYEFYVEDANGVKYSERVALREPPILRIETTLLTYSNGFNTSCFYCNDGTVTLTVSGGLGSYTYMWSDGITIANRNNLAAKSYSVTVKDANQCVPPESNVNLSLIAPERDDWTANGNSNVGANSFIGTTTNFPLVFKSNNNEGARLLPNGRLGIGTSTPTSTIDVNGTARIRGINSNYGGIPFATGETRLVSTDADGNLRDEFVDVRGGTNCTKMVLGWSARPSLDISMAYSTQSGVTVYPQDLTHPDDIIKCPQLGNVGIGVLQPNFKVDVDGDVNVTGNFKINGTSINQSQWFNISENGGLDNSISYSGHNVYIKNPGGGNVLKLTSDNGGIEIGSSTGKVTFYYQGNYTDILAGQVNANKVKVCASGWCDFVFDKTYNLKPLIEIEKYIQENKHLPDVPSEAEVTSNEVDLFEMQKIQMRKIEELTLYLIELKKENEELKLLIKK